MFGSNKDDDSTVKDMTQGVVKTVAATKAAQAVTSDEDDEKSGGKGKFVALFLMGAAALAYYLNRRRSKPGYLPIPPSERSNGSSRP
ncbi:MAG: hypothetical protein M3252_03635 [Actinomycetota bacterium]|nr:hypothetical protein [Actinomycetota bacterium]